MIFDLGNVIIDWNPRHLYRQLFADDEEAMERFLAEVTTPAWNRALDGGRSFAEAIAELQREHPQHHDLIAAYWHRWPEMIGEVNAETVAIARELRSRGVRVFALSDWSVETYPFIKDWLDGLQLFEDIQISGEIGMTKANPQAFRLGAQRFNIDPSKTIFIDDIAGNVDSARAAGLTGIRFTTAEALRQELIEVGLL